MTTGMEEVLVKIVAEVLSILSIVTKEMKRNRASELFCKIYFSINPYLVRNISQETTRKDGY